MLSRNVGKELQLHAAWYPAVVYILFIQLCSDYAFLCLCIRASCVFGLALLNLQVNGIKLSLIIVIVSSLSTLGRVFTILYLKQAMFMGYTVLPLFCI